MSPAQLKSFSKQFGQALLANFVDGTIDIIIKTTDGGPVLLRIVDGAGRAGISVSRLACGADIDYRFHCRVDGDLVV